MFLLLLCCIRLENLQRLAEDESLPEHVHKCKCASSYNIFLPQLLLITLVILVVAIKRVVARVCLNQSLKGILTAGEHPIVLKCEIYFDLKVLFCTVICHIKYWLKHCRECYT